MLVASWVLTSECGVDCLFRLGREEGFYLMPVEYESGYEVIATQRDSENTEKFVP